MPELKDFLYEMEDEVYFLFSCEALNETRGVFMQRVYSTISDNRRD